MIIGGIEAGGTKFVCGIGNEKGEVLERVSFPTETPEITLAKVVDFFKDKNIERLGIGSFGPIDVNLSSKTYGYITKTPKLAWTDCDVIGYLKKYFDIPIYFDTDVNGAALGEATWGAAQRLVNFILILSPEKIILGGGVMKQSQLFPKIRENVVKLLNGYVQTKEILEKIDEYIVYPKLGDNAGLLGALALTL